MEFILQDIHSLKNVVFSILQEAGTKVSPLRPQGVRTFLLHGFVRHRNHSFEGLFLLCKCRTLIKKCMLSDEDVDDP